MSEPMTSQSLLPGLLKVAEAARHEPKRRLRALAHHLDVAALERAFNRLRGNAAVGIDGVSKEAYGQNLEANLQVLHEGLRSKRYRHQPIRRVHIPKEGGKTRPIGISSTEDKIVQDSLRELLEVIYEQDFLDCSYGFRPGRSAHDALRAFHEAVSRGEANFVYEADIVSFFDRLSRPKLKELLERRLADKSLMRLIGKCLHVGILDGVELTTPDEGTVQGSVLSPLLANVYLHHALDLWFETQVKPRLRGRATLIRFADDFICCFEREDDARWVMSFIGERMAAYSLELHPEKTRLVDFRRPPRSQRKGKGPGTLDFLGFTHLWRRSRRGYWYVQSKTRRAKVQRTRRSIHDLCRRQRHRSVLEQHKALRRKLQGHCNYFAVRGNSSAVSLVLFWARRSWYKWLKRRSQRSRLNWDRFNDLLRDYPLPTPRVTKSLWAWAP